MNILRLQLQESTDESFDDSDEEGSQSFDAHTPDNLRLTKSSSGYCISCTPSPFVKKLSVVSSSPNIKQMAGHGINCVGSRFKIVPVESRYKRGRWQAWDYYLDENGHYSHTNTHAPVVEDGQFRSAAVHLTGDSFVAPSRNSNPTHKPVQCLSPTPSTKTTKSAQNSCSSTYTLAFDFIVCSNNQLKCHNSARQPIFVRCCF
uniref:Uncharacterized protein n=1 Tax=Ditylenchus dipsaci TaxID=166011 RepID=A0A915EPJ7_9BILA